jgi:2-iminobutanoate/2-iminopropanoate deaminase
MTAQPEPAKPPKPAPGERFLAEIREQPDALVRLLEHEADYAAGPAVRVGAGGAKGSRSRPTGRSEQDHTRAVETGGSMSRRALQPRGLAVPKLPYSPVVVAGSTVYTAGQVGFDEDGTLVEGGIEEQTRQALENLRRCLEEAGAGFADVVKVNVFLADFGDFDGYNAVYRDCFEEPFPARTTVQAGLPGGILVEIEAVAQLSA